MFGTKTHVDVDVTRLPAGLRIKFTQRTGASTLGPVKFGETHIEMLLDPSTNESKLGLKTDLTVGQTRSRSTERSTAWAPGSRARSRST